MIREQAPRDLNRILNLWLETNLEAHAFVDPQFWHGYYEKLKKLFPLAEIYVFEQDDQVIGFVGLMDGFVAGIFVDKKMRSQGVGKQLLDYAKNIYPSLSLHVFSKNTRAVHFYQREGFSVKEEKVDQMTQENEILLTYERSSSL